MKLTEDLNVPAFFGPLRTDETYTICARFITFNASLFSISDLSKSRVFGPARNSTECNGRITADSRSTRCLTVKTWPTCPSNVDWNGVNMSINLSLYFEYTLGMTIDLLHSVSSIFWDVGGGDSVSALSVRKTLGSDCSSWNNNCGALEPTVVEISSFSCPSTLCLLKGCCFVVVLLTSIKNWRQGKFQ